MDKKEEFINSMVSVIKNLSNEALQFDKKDEVYKLYENTLSQMWNLIGNNGILLNPIRYSVKAQEIFEKANLKEQGFQSLSEFIWNDRRRLKNKANFACLKDLEWEHAYTRHDFALNAIKIVENGEDVDSKLIKLIKEHQIVWITKEENKCLSEHGYKSHRPNGWKPAYKECGIELVKQKTAQLKS